ncbi:TauD/TfdA family dioxygenase [Nocardia callitridis]|uniref:TauD/TfdA-like domain-containing protein n=1 Tax=Nocardia callitridis TaxID=648753 RepID=A0ABP9JSE6_9NOCA
MLFGLIAKKGPSVESALSERRTLHTREVERRALPIDAGRAVRALAAEIAATLDSTLDDIARAARTLNDAKLIEQIDARVDELPAAVRTAMRPPATDAGATIVHALPLTDDEFGPTPPSWQEAAAWSGDRTRRARSMHLDLAMLLLARCAGEPFGWEGQQNGRLVNNIVPASGHEDEQSGASSKTLLTPHTEDAFHPERAHLLMLGCLRNPDEVATTVSSVHHVELTARQRHLLSKPTLPILPDVSYGDGHQRFPTPALPTLWHHDDADAASATLRYDPAYTPLADADAEFRAAYTHLTSELARVRMSASLAPGEILLVDNDVVVHGRVPFTARYDGTDRWLKRVNIRIPERPRRSAETRENGYGQHTVTPFRSVGPHFPSTGGSVPDRTGQDATHDRGPLGYP